MRKVGYLISMVGLLLVFTVKIGQAHRGAVRRRRVQRIWADKRGTSGCKISPLEPRSASRAPRPGANHHISV
jgi:hypothetical protein